MEAHLILINQNGFCDILNSQEAKKTRRYFLRSIISGKYQAKTFSSLLRFYKDKKYYFLESQIIISECFFEQLEEEKEEMFNLKAHIISKIPFSQSLYGNVFFADREGCKWLGLDVSYNNLLN